MGVIFVLMFCNKQNNFIFLKVCSKNLGYNFFCQLFFIFLVISIPINSAIAQNKKTGKQVDKSIVPNGKNAKKSKEDREAKNKGKGNKKELKDAVAANKLLDKKAKKKDDGKVTTNEELSSRKIKQAKGVVPARPATKQIKELLNLSKKNSDSLAKVKRASSPWLQKKWLQDSLAQAKKTGQLAEANTLLNNKTITQSFKDSLAKVKRASSPWLQKKWLQDSLAQAQKTDQLAEVNTLLNNKTITQSFKDSLAKVKRASSPWMQKKWLQDSLAQAKKKEANKKDSIAKKENAERLQVKDSIALAKKTLEEEKIKALQEKKKLIVNLDSIIANDSNATNKSVTNYAGNYASDNMMDYYTNQQYNKVAKLGEAYLKKFPMDTNIRLKTGISFLFLKYPAKGFDFIDKVFGSKDSLIQFYSVLPYINSDAKEQTTYKAIVEHCKAIDHKNLWTLFTEASYFFQNDSLEAAKLIGEVLHKRIETKKDAASMAHLYPNILFALGDKKAAISALEQCVVKYPGISNLEHNLFEMYKKTSNYEKAYELCKRLINYQELLDDYIEEQINLCIILNKKEEACSLIKKSNENFEWDEKLIKASCEDEISNLFFQTGATYEYKINASGSLNKLQVKVDSVSETSVFINYTYTKKKAETNNLVIANSIFDSATNLNYLFFDNKKFDSTLLPLRISKMAYSQIILQQQVYLDIGNGLQLFTLQPLNDDNNIFIDRIEMKDGSKKLLPTLHLINTETNEQIWILKNPQNPMLIKIDAQIGIELYKTN